MKSFETMNKDLIYQLAAQLQDSMTNAMEMVRDQRTVKQYLRNPELAAMQPDEELRKIACEIFTTYDAIRYNVTQIRFEDYEVFVEVETINAPF